MKKFGAPGIIIIGLIVTAVFFYQTVFSGKLPVPTDTLVGLYHPWRDLYGDSNPRGIPYKNFLITDPIRQQIPWRKAVIDSWKRGQKPALNSYTFGGVPLDANIQAAPFYPLNVLFFLFNFPAAWTLLIMLQPLLAGLLLYWYLRHLRLHPAAAFMGALAWAFGGFATAWLTWGTIMHAALWLPLMLMSIDNILVPAKKRRYYIRWAAMLFVGAAMTVLAGHIQVALYCGILTGCYLIWKRQQIREKSVISWVWLACVTLLVVAAVQWIPMVSFFTESGRMNAQSGWLKPGWFLPFRHLAQFIAPDFFGNPATLNYWGEWNYGEFVGYIGIIPFAFAVSALFLGSVPGFFTSVILASLVFMLPTPVSNLPFLLRIPVLSVMQPTRLMVLVDFSLAMLAAYGMHHLIAGSTKRIWRSLAVVGVVMLCLWAIVLGGKFFGADSQFIANLAVAKRNLYVPTAFFGMTVIWVFIFSRMSVKAWKMLGLVVFCAAVMADLFRFGWKFTPFTPMSYFFPETKVISFLSRQEKPFRIMSLDDRIMPPNVSGYYGVESIEGYDPVAPIRYENFLAASERGSADGISASGFNRIYTAHNIDSPLLPYLNVRYVLALTDVERPFLTEVMREGETRVYAYTGTLPRAYLADTVETVSYKNVLSSLFSDTSPRRAVYDGSEYIMNTPLTGDESVEIISYEPDHLVLKASVTNKRLLVVLNRFDARWKAVVDGKPVPIRRVNYLFMGLAVPTGIHDIILSYR